MRAKEKQETFEDFKKRLEKRGYFESIKRVKDGIRDKQRTKRKKRFN